MRILFVRHGEPDYKNDCLTETGKRQAQAAALRLEREGISEIYASPMGRARETAGYTAERLGLPVTILDYMHEIDWGGPDVPEKGHPWTLSDHLLEEGFDLSRDNWREHPYFKNNVVTECYDMVSQKFDGFLEEQGYHHEKGRFFCTAAEDKTIADFHHFRKHPHKAWNLCASDHRIVQRCGPHPRAFQRSGPSKGARSHKVTKEGNRTI